jgi:DNA-binding transcriptional LysR family regulator
MSLAAPRDESAARLWHGSDSIRATHQIRRRRAISSRFIARRVFATQWLVPGITRFSAAHPDIDVRLHRKTRIDIGRGPRFDRSCPPGHF